MSNLTQQRLMELLNYDPNTGIFTRKISLSNRTPIGSVAGSRNNSDGYLYILVDAIRYPAHSLAWLYCFGTLPSLLDHKDTDRTNNRISNLRLANKSTNGANRGINKNNTTGYKGVIKHPKGYIARIKVNRKCIHLGTFKDLIAAAKCYDQGAIKYFGEFAVTNHSLGLI